MDSRSPERPLPLSPPPSEPPVGLENFAHTQIETVHMVILTLQPSPNRVSVRRTAEHDTSTEQFRDASQANSYRSVPDGDQILADPAADQEDPVRKSARASQDSGSLPPTLRKRSLSTSVKSSRGPDERATDLTENGKKLMASLSAMATSMRQNGKATVLKLLNNEIEPPFSRSDFEYFLQQEKSYEAFEFYRDFHKYRTFALRQSRSVTTSGTIPLEKGGKHKSRAALDDDNVEEDEVEWNGKSEDWSAFLVEQEIVTRTSELIQTFIVPGSPKEINVSSKCRRSILQEVNDRKNAHPDVFLPALNEVLNMLKTDVLPRFLNHTIDRARSALLDGSVPEDAETFNLPPLPEREPQSYAKETSDTTPTGTENGTRSLARKASKSLLSLLKAAVPTADVVGIAAREVTPEVTVVPLLLVDTIETAEAAKLEDGKDEEVVGIAADTTVPMLVERGFEMKWILQRKEL
ncbi:hypothetical protein HDU93_007727 [Gonapodya sp. JEL0774]|nr:hypothetical protein HDU93_007727 [Gonapodya sp. JEL0774]